MKKLTLYTDGACSGNPGPGGWGCVLIYGDHRLEISGFEDNTTNNRMELTAAIKGLEALKVPCEVDLYSDSSYLTDAFLKKWLISWKKNGWVKSNKEPVLNRDLWERLLELTKVHSVNWNRVKGHSTNVENNRCDKLATGAIANRK